MDKRINWIDIAKGIGIIIVVYWHSLKGVHRYIGFNNVIYFAQTKLFDCFCMAMFFMISGFFVSSWSSKPFVKALIVKARSLLVPYIIWSFIQGLAMLVVHAGNITWKSLVLIPFFTIDQMWFIYDLFIIFILFYVLRRLFHNPNVLLVVSLLLCIASPMITFWQLSGIFYYFFFFEIGNYWKLKIGLGNFEKWSILISSFLLFTLVYYINARINSSNIILRIIIAILGSIFVISLSTKIYNKILAKIGRASMYIYILHFLFMAPTYIALSKIKFDIAWMAIILSFLVGLIIPLLIYKLLPQGKLRKICFGR